MARSPSVLKKRVADATDVVFGDVHDSTSLAAALAGVHTAYYLIHSMGTGGDFEEQDREAAQNFASAARDAGVRRIIYLGGLGDEDEDLSSHLRSRQEVGEVLKESGADVVEFRASIIIGSGSLSFEMVRALVQKLPIMLWPKWVSTQASPLAVEDVLSYLTAILEMPLTGNRIYEIGSTDTVSYGEIMKEYARQKGLRRVTVPVPFLSPRISSLWLGLVTPIYARIGKKLVLSLQNPTVVRDKTALEDFDIQPMGISDAIRRALENEDREFAETRWSDSMSSAGDIKTWGGATFGNRKVDSRTAEIDAPVEVAFEPIRKIGGETGWYFANWLWKLRGFIDLLFGGVGLRRGRKSFDQLSVGDTLDFWRVEKIEDNHLLRLSAEMKLPGRAWLEFEVTPHEDGGSRIRQTAEFDPVGLMGRLYWYSVWPLHGIIFQGMLNGIVEAAQTGEV